VRTLTTVGKQHEVYYPCNSPTSFKQKLQTQGNRIRSRAGSFMFVMGQINSWFRCSVSHCFEYSHGYGIPGLAVLILLPLQKMTIVNVMTVVFQHQTHCG